VRVTFVAMILVLLLAIAVCWVSLAFTEHVVGEIDVMRVKVLELQERGDMPAAQEQLTQLSAAWARYAKLLEMTSSHEDLHSITELIISADSDLRNGDIKDYRRSMALLGELIDHILDVQRLMITNVI